MLCAPYSVLYFVWNILGTCCALNDLLITLYFVTKINFSHRKWSSRSPTQASSLQSISNTLGYFMWYADGLFLFHRWNFHIFWNVFNTPQSSYYMDIKFMCIYDVPKLNHLKSVILACMNGTDIKYSPSLYCTSIGQC